MKNAYKQFNSSFQHIDELESLYKFLKEDLNLKVDLSDILRSQIVYSVSALDKLIHDLVRIGMLESYHGQREKTNRFKAFTISSDTLTEIIDCINSSSAKYPAEYWFEQEIVIRHKHISYQNPDKISEGLSLIWPEQHKWQVISTIVGQNERSIKATLTNIINRRNIIVHESDIELDSGKKNRIDHADATYSSYFIKSIGAAIYNCVVQNPGP